MQWNIFQIVAVYALLQKFPKSTGFVSSVNETALGLAYVVSPLIGGIAFDRCMLLLCLEICKFIATLANESTFQWGFR